MTIQNVLQTTKIKRFIFVRFQVEGVHHYAAAGTDPKLATGGWDDVSFLQYDHRHMFGFEVKIEVFHDDRDLEFIQESRFMKNLYKDGLLDMNGKSCEMLADELYEELSVRYDIAQFPRFVSIEVNEDDENGAYSEYSIQEQK